MRDVLVSVITVCYNSSKTIRKTIESVLAQTYSNYEHIFIDSKSTDDTIGIINEYEQAYGERLRILVEKDKGIYDAMNKGITLARGEIIAITNSDDWLEKTAIEDVVKAYRKRQKDLVIITGNLVRTTEACEFLFLQKHTEITLTGLMNGMPLQHPAVFVAKKVYDTIGTFDISFRYIADYDFIWRCFASKQVEFLFTGTTTSYMREGGASDTFKFKNIWERTTERYRLRKKFIGRFKAFVTSTKFFVVEIIKQFVKRILPKRLKEIYYNRKHK